jgi:hypothetical protein
MSNTQTPFVLNPTDDHKEPTWQSEYRMRIRAFAEATKIDPQVVVTTLKDSLGVEPDEPDCLTLLDSEEFTPANDIFKHFVDSGLAKIARVRMGLAHLRGKTDLVEARPTVNGNGGLDTLASAVQELVAQSKPIENWTIEELLSRYDEQHPEVIKRLSAMTHGRPCIILNRENGQVKTNIPESAKMVRTAMKQPTSDRALVNGKIVKVYRVGTEFPATPIDESPFFPNVALVNGFCAASGTDWNGVEHEARVLVRVYIQHVETAKLSKKQMKETCEDARKGAAFFRENYQETAIKFDELKERDELPKLKMLPDQYMKIANPAASSFGGH